MKRELPKFSAFKRVAIAISVLLLIFFGSLLLVRKSEPIQQQAKATEAKGALTSVRVALTGYQQEWKRFPKSLSEVGFADLNKDSTISSVLLFESSSQVPPSLLKQLEGSQYPFLAEQSYQIVAFQKQGEGKCWLFSLNSATGTIQKVSEQILCD